MQWADFIYVLITVLAIGFLAAGYTVFNMRKIDAALVHEE
jgi:ABC-type antimicrobial peptide transport system permease subunit